MNKATKGALAAAAAAAILAGGAGTMAAWSDNASGTSGGTVQAGSLSVEQTAGGTWTWKGSNNNREVNFDNDKIVPGDVLEYTATYHVELSGTNLKAELVPSLAGVTGSLVDSNSIKVSSSSGDTITVNKSGDHTITTTVTFPADKTTGQTESADLSGASVILNQKTS